MKEAKSYCVTSFGNYAEGLGTLRASGGDIGGGSEMLILESNQNHARTEDTEVCPCLPASMGLGGVCADDSRCASVRYHKESTETLLERSTPTTSRAAGSEKDWRER